MMSDDYLHNNPDLQDLLNIVSNELSISPVLVEKDYWIMHTLYGLQAQNMIFFLKGGTSLSKGYKIIDRFSEDIDILIDPPEGQLVYLGKNQNKTPHKESRRQYYDWLAKTITVPGIENVERDVAFDNETFRSGGIRLNYPTEQSLSKDLKTGILLEVGFDSISPNEPLDISSWAYEFGSKKVKVIDNRALDVPCYHPGYTLIEKMQAISTKFRKQKITGGFSENFMRHYYDIYKLLENNLVTSFIGTPKYLEHKDKRFGSKNEKDISKNEAFHLQDLEEFNSYEKQYELSKSLYYIHKPEFKDIILRIREWAPKL